MSAAYLEVHAVPAGPAFVQDLGRHGFLAHAVPAGGALVPELLVAANRAVGNAPGAPALELFGGLDVTTHTTGEVPALSLDGARFAPRPGTARFVVPRPSRHRVQYVAVAGGIAVPAVLGGRGTLPSAALGGHEGRALRATDRLALGDSFERAPAESLAHEDALLARAVRVLPGPDARTHFAHGALDALVRTAWCVDARSDRGGLRLAGTAIARKQPGPREYPQPMVPGAIEVALDGTPLVLGPDHPTTGGYPVLAVVARADLGALFARRPSAPVRFVRTDARAARAAWVAHTKRLYGESP